MHEALAVTGYIETNKIDEIKAMEKIEIWPEQDIEDVVIRVNTTDVAEVRVGSTKAGRTLVQLILRNEAVVETIVRTSADSEGLQAYHDPVLNRIRQEATAKKILL